MPWCLLSMTWVSFFRFLSHVSLCFPQFPGATWAPGFTLGMRLSAAVDAVIPWLVQSPLGLHTGSTSYFWRSPKSLFNFSLLFLHTWLSTALLSPLSPIGDSIRCDSAAAFTFTALRVLAGEVAQGLKIIQCPGPSLFSVHLWRHVGLWVVPPSSQLLRGWWRPSHSFSCAAWLSSRAEKRHWMLSSGGNCLHIVFPWRCLQIS